MVIQHPFIGVLCSQPRGAEAMAADDVRKSTRIPLELGTDEDLPPHKSNCQVEREDDGAFSKWYSRRRPGDTSPKHVCGCCSPEVVEKSKLVENCYLTVLLHCKELVARMEILWEKLRLSCLKQFNTEKSMSGNIQWHPSFPSCQIFLTWYLLLVSEPLLNSLSAVLAPCHFYLSIYFYPPVCMMNGSFLLETSCDIIVLPFAHHKECHFPPCPP